ncbi:MAG: gluconate 2-dehydrogenase subunit 3 family protein [Alphaproteobacteria bacterium]|nr:gluconate 2-dehydrogenase subunit 3 family protein [Alphaproteobacteria bacterium]
MSDQDIAGAAETSFADEETQALEILVEMIIPASDEYSLPGAGDAVIFADILATAGVRHGPVCAALSALDALARKSQDNGFGALDLDQRDGLVTEFRRLHPAAADLLATITVQCYYRDDRVMRALDMETRPPFPAGFTVDQGDWSLLNPVRGRPEFYRKAP